MKRRTLAYSNKYITSDGQVCMQESIHYIFGFLFAHYIAIPNKAPIVFKVSNKAFKRC